MADRTGFIAVDGAAYNADDHDKMPKGWLGYASVTADQTFASTDTDLTGLTVTVTVAASRLLLVSAFVNVELSAASDTTGSMTLRIKEDGTTVQTASWRSEVRGAVGQEEQMTFSPFVLRTPSAGSHTYKLSGFRGGSVDLELQAGSAKPSYITVIDMGPSS